MKKITLFLMLLSTVAFAKFQYTSPMAGSTLNTPATTIILREGRFIDPASINSSLFVLNGSKSGLHTFRVVFSDDKKTIILYPTSPFAYNEEVSVSVSAGLRTIDAKSVEAYSFKFTTHREYTAEEKATFKTMEQLLFEEAQRNGMPVEQPDAETRDFAGSITIKTNTTTSTDQVFYDAWNGSFFGSTKFNGYVITNTNGDSIFQSAKVSTCFDFDVNENGLLSVYNSSKGGFDILDSNMVIIDTWKPGNGRTADPHEFNFTADGRGFMVAAETHFVDMDDYTNGQYHQNATLMTTIIQVFDQSKNVIMEWRGWDHVSVLETNQFLSSTYIDVIHTNSITLDHDGHIISSNRHLDQINKIDINTGEFIWRLGGDNNQFTFIGDAEKFSYQHHARVLPNGNITLWDNGNGHVPTHSMGKEYQLDLINKTATLVWSYQPKTYTGGNAYFYAMGSCQRLENGNTIMNGGWDNSSNQSNIFEVDPDGNLVWEVAYDNAKSLVGYRAIRRSWKPCAMVDDADIYLTKLTDVSVKVNWDSVKNATSYDLQWRKVGTTSWKLKNTVKIAKKIKNLKPSTTYEFQLRSYCTNGYISDWTAPQTFTTLPAKLESESLSQIMTVELSPNPANDKINISFESDDEGDVTFTIYNIEGKVLFTSTETMTEGTNSFNFDISNFNAGFYFAEVKSEGSKQVSKFIKQ